MLNLTKIRAGPLCTQILADLGADVIKVERFGGDDTHHWPPFRDGTGTIFLSVKRKRASRSILSTLMAWRSAIAFAFKATLSSKASAPEWRIGLASAGTPCAPLTCGSSTPTSRTTASKGPMREGKGKGKGYDLIAQAFSGMFSITGQPDGDMVRSPFSPVDLGTGLNAVIAILAALLQMERTGTGVKLEASLFDSAVGVLGYILQSFGKPEQNRSVAARRTIRCAPTRRSTRPTRRSFWASPTIRSGGASACLPTTPPGLIIRATRPARPACATERT